LWFEINSPTLFNASSVVETKEKTRRKCLLVNLTAMLSHHHNKHGLKTCSFEAQGVPGPSILLSVFPYPAIPEVGTGMPASVGGFYPFVPGGLPISFDTV
jgi:hypothetical protein